MSRTKSRRTTRSDRLLGVLSAYSHFLVVMHDNPDPDAIATGWSVKVLIEEKLGKPARVLGGGGIVRAENSQMVRLLEPPIELVDDIEVSADTATILVDCGLESTHQLLTRHSIEPVAVIDHHLTGPLRFSLPFRDIRDNVAASATIAAGYLRDQEIVPSVELATAGLYAIRTETRGCQTRYSRLDRSIILWLTERADQGLIAEIENAPLSREYFGDLLLAMQNAFLYDDAVFCLLPRASGTEIVGEVADLLIRCRDIGRVLCAAKVGEQVYLSARTGLNAGNATDLIRATLDGLGSSGGHAQRAGGKIPDTGQGQKIAESLEEELRTRWLAACNVDRKRGVRLVALREIVNNL